jgi:riboflavin biosynthesis pyrimidine reductase
VVYLAPLLVGGAGARSAIEGAGFAPIGDALRLTPTSVERVGDDLRWEGDVHRDR